MRAGRRAKAAGMRKLLPCSLRGLPCIVSRLRGPVKKVWRASAPASQGVPNWGKEMAVSDACALGPVLGVPMRFSCSPTGALLPAQYSFDIDDTYLCFAVTQAWAPCFAVQPPPAPLPRNLHPMFQSSRARASKSADERGSREPAPSNIF